MPRVRNSSDSACRRRPTWCRRVVAGVVDAEQLPRQRAGDQRAAAEAHDRQAGGQARAVREPLDQRRDRRDVADAEADAADDAVPEVDQPQLARADAERRRPGSRWPRSTRRRTSPCAGRCARPRCRRPRRTGPASRSRCEKMTPIAVWLVSKCFDQRRLVHAGRVRLPDTQVHRQRGRRDQPAAVSRAARRCVDGRGIPGWAVVAVRCVVAVMRTSDREERDGWAWDRTQANRDGRGVRRGAYPGSGRNVS